jgi:hypothetical protein
MDVRDERDSLQRVAYQRSVSALRHQEAVLTRLWERTGTLLAASSIVASFLGARALDDGFGTLTVLGLVAFVLSVLASVYVLFSYLRRPPPGPALERRARGILRMSVTKNASPPPPPPRLGIPETRGNGVRKG